MSRYEKCSKDIATFAQAVLEEHESHKPLVEAKVKIDFVFAFGERNDKEELVSDAIRKYGARALAITRKISEKDRSKGLGDAEILIDHDYWDEADEAVQKALLDQQLHYLEVLHEEENNAVIRDSNGRPKLKLRKPDVQVSWFKVIALRNHVFSQECIQARAIFDQHGQAFFPWLATEVEAVEEEPVPR